MDGQIRTAELLSRIRDEQERLNTLLGALQESQMLQPGVEATWSVKDILAHITFWELHTLTALQQACRHEPYTRLARPDEDGDVAVDRINQECYLANQQRPLAEVLAAYQRTQQDTLEAIGTLLRPDPFDARAIEASFGRPLEPLIAGDTYEHYEEHREAIERYVGTMGAAPRA